MGRISGTASERQLGSISPMFQQVWIDRGAALGSFLNQLLDQFSKRLAPGERDVAGGARHVLHR